MDHIRIGATRHDRVQVDESNAISFLGLPGARVLSTPHMIGYMERASRDLLKSMLPEGEDSVGTVVNVKHLAGAPLGAEVRFDAEVTGVDGRRVTFRVEAFHGEEKVGEGEHERFAIDVQRFAEKMKAKLKAR